MNFRNFGDAPPPEGGSGRPQGLSRQPSVYSLTFDEFQSTWGGGPGRDFGSMNMDELLKNIWSAEETQAMTSSVAAGQGSTPGGNLQRQGSLTLPRTLSQKTVEEVWKDVIKDTAGSKDFSGGGGGSRMPQSQQTLGEMTLEEFLVRAGVVREDAQQPGRPNNSNLFDDLSQSNNNTGLSISFQQACQNNGAFGHQIPQNTNPVSSQPTGFTLNVNGARSSIQPHQQQAQQQPLLPKPANLSFTSPMQFTNNSQLPSPGGRGAVGIGDLSLNNSLVQGFGMAGLGTGGVTVTTGSPANPISSSVTGKTNVDTSSLSPVPYAFSRGRKSHAAVEKVLERRQRRMIKNRESAARSRARKQAYTLELEAEVAQLKKLNKELQQKNEMMEMQKKQVLEMDRQWAGNRHGLRRTLTGPW